MPQTPTERINELMAYGPTFSGFKFTNGSYQCEVVGFDVNDEGRTVYRVRYTHPHQGIVAHMWENETAMWKHWKRELGQAILS